MRVAQGRSLSPFAIGLLIIVLVAIGTYFNFTKANPFASPYVLYGAFEETNTIRVDSPVRIAGIDVGVVTDIDPVVVDGRAQEQGIVTMELSERARPIRRDATLKIRPRLWLEGNYFVDIQPGSPSEPELDDQATVPVNQTSAPVQIDQVLGILQSDTREELRVLLKELGDGLVTYGGASGYNESLRYAQEAFRESSRVNEALLGREPHDLSNLVDNLGTTLGLLSANRGALQDLVQHLHIVGRAFAREHDALARGVAEIPRVFRAAHPAFDALNDAFPTMRAFARELRPGVQTTPATLDAVQPFVRQSSRLFSQRELGGLARDLQRAVPRLAALARRSPDFLLQSRAFSACFLGPIDEFQESTVPDQIHPASGRTFEEFTYALAGISGENRNHDGNGPYIRIHGSGGIETFSVGDDFVGTSLFPLQGVQPRKGAVGKAPFRPDELCEDQEAPNLDPGDPGAAPNSASAGSGSQSRGLSGASANGGGGSQSGSEAIQEASMDALFITRDFENAKSLRAHGREEEADRLQADAEKRLRTYLREQHPRVLEALGPLMGADDVRRGREQANRVLRDVTYSMRQRSREEGR